MTKFALALAVVLGAMLSFTTGAAEDKAPEKKAEEKKAEEKKPGEKKADEKKPAGEVQTLNGLLAPDAASGKTALKTRDEDKGTNKTYILWAEGDVAKTLAELLKKKVFVDVTGTVAPDGTNVKVTSVSEDKTKKRGGKGRGGGKTP